MLLISASTGGESLYRLLFQCTALCPPTFRPLLILKKKTHCGKAKHRKPFVVIYLIICSSPSKWFCTGPRGCAGEHSLHYLAGQSLSSPCVFGPEDSVRLKISPQVRALFSLISDISEYANLFSDARFCWKGIIVYWRICCTLMSKKKNNYL